MERKEAMIYLEANLYRRLKRLATLKTMPVNKLAGLYIEAMVAFEESQLHQAVTGWVEEAITLALLKEVESKFDQLHHDGLLEVHT